MDAPVDIAGDASEWGPVLAAALCRQGAVLLRNHGIDTEGILAIGRDLFDQPDSFKRACVGQEGGEHKAFLRGYIAPFGESGSAGETGELREDKEQFSLGSKEATRRSVFEVANVWPAG